MRRLIPLTKATPKLMLSGINIPIHGHCPRRYEIPAMCMFTQEWKGQRAWRKGEEIMDRNRVDSSARDGVWNILCCMYVLYWVWLDFCLPSSWHVFRSREGLQYTAGEYLAHRCLGLGICSLVNSSWLCEYLCMCKSACKGEILLSGVRQRERWRERTFSIIDTPG